MRNNLDTIHTPPNERFKELQTLISEAQALISDSAADYSSEAVEALRERFAAVQEQCADMYAKAKTKVVAGAKATDATIRANPYQSIAIAAGVGLLIGVLLGRRGK